LLAKSENAVAENLKSNNYPRKIAWSNSELNRASCKKAIDYVVKEMTENQEFINVL